MFYNQQNKQPAQQHQPAQQQQPAQQFQAFQSHIQENLLANYANQDQQQINQSIMTEQRNRQIHLEQLQKEYQIQLQDPLEIMGMTREEILCKLNIKNSIILIRIVLEEGFPKIKPKIYLQKKLFHNEVDLKTQEVLYSKFFEWKDQSKLLELINSLKNRFTISPLQDDEMTKELKQLKNKTNPKTLYDKMMSKELPLIFKGVDPKQYKNLINQPEFSEIFSLEECQILSQYNLDLISFNEKYSNQILNKYQMIMQKRNQVMEQAEICEQRKYVLLKTFKQCNMIQERFEKTKILALAEQSIQKLQDDVEEEILDEKLSEKDKCMKYFENKKKLHSLMIKKTKLEQIL